MNQLKAKLQNMLTSLRQDEDGVSALETAIILIAFVVVASIFAFTVLSAGTTSTEQSKEAIYAGLEEVRSSVEVRGALVASTNNTAVQEIVFTLANSSGGGAIDVTSTVSNTNTMIIDYRDSAQRSANVDWTLSWVTRNDSDDLLEEGELAEITVDLSGLTTALGTNTEFALEVKPASGGIVIMERTTPAYLDTIVDLR